MNLACEDLLCQLVHQFPLHQALDRPGAISRIVTALDHPVFELLAELDSDTFLGKLVLKLAHLDMEDVPDVVPGQRIKHDDLVNPVEELRPDSHLQNVHDLALALFKHLTPLGYRPHFLGRIGAGSAN